VKLNFVFVELVLIAAAALPARSASPESPWEALKHLSKHRVYTVLNRDGSCFSGAFVSISDNVISLNQRQFNRSDIIRISGGETPDVHTAVYSGRSSWADLEALQSPPYYSSLMVITTDERQFTGPLIGVASDQLTLMVEGKEMRFAKEFLARVFLTGKKPAFEQSGLHWNPLDLPKKVMAPMQPIPLYEVSAREDNSKLECSPTYRRPQ
jgi:hypothetical protein